MTFLTELGVKDKGGSSIGIQEPDGCPVCHYKNNPKLKAASFDPEVNEHRTQVVFLCPNRKCGQFFIATYTRETRGWTLRSLKPMATKPAEFDNFITEISPTFVQIFNEAVAAEGYGLTQICGVGFRKALEFLIKDFLKATKADAPERIERMPLGGDNGCIATYIKEPKLKAMSTGATWLGNDETHYVRKWEDKDLSDLKKLLELTVHWMLFELMTAEYAQSLGLNGAPSQS